jgi:hypothetical protein
MATIFVGAEPQEYKMNFVLARSQNDLVQFLEVELAFYGLDHFPRDAS